MISYKTVRFEAGFVSRFYGDTGPADAILGKYRNHKGGFCCEHFKSKLGTENLHDAFRRK